MLAGNSIDGAKVTVLATVGERFLNLIHRGFSKAYIFGSKIKLSFLGASPQVYKPQMPLKAYLAISYYDGSQIAKSQIVNKINTTIQFYTRLNGSPIRLEKQFTMSDRNPGIWEITFDPKTEFRGSRSLEQFQKCRIEAFYSDSNHGTHKAQLDLYASYTPTNRLLQVSTSTNNPRVGEYIIFHVRANYFVDRFSYVIISKGILLTSGRQEMSSSIKTFSVTLSSEMAPSATIMIYNIARGGEVISDAITFPVDGISRNNFSVTLNNRKDKTGDNVEVVVLGQPGTYVGLSGLDRDLQMLDVGNQLNYADVIRKMNTFDSNPNVSLTHLWISRENGLEKFLHFPSPTFGVDSNRTFEVS